MHTYLRGLVVPTLVLTALGLGCAPSNEVAADAPEPVAASTTPDPSTTAIPDPKTPTATEPGPGPSSDLCGQLKVIADIDKEVSSLPAAKRVEELSRRWPEGAAAYDKAIVLASPDLAADLRAIKRVSEIMMEVMAGQGSADPSAAVSELARTHMAEVRAGGLASIKANRFTEETCGFSLNNE